MKFILMAILLAGCAECETVGAMQCNGNAVEICNTNNKWELSSDCDEIEDFGLGYEWTCCVDPWDGEHACLPVEECDGGA